MPQKRHVVDQNVAQLRKADVELVSEKEKRAKKGDRHRLLSKHLAVAKSACPLFSRPLFSRFRNHRSERRESYLNAP